MTTILSQLVNRSRAVMLLLLAIAFIPTSLVAESYSPAKFAFKGEELARSIAFSDRLTAVTLYCRADISSTGSVSRINCYDNSGNSALEVETQDAVTDLPFTPASVNGENIPVRMSFRIAYNASEKGVNAILIPNLGTMQAQYGRDYIAPQERLDIADWYESYHRNSWVNGGEFLQKGALARVAATVREDGKPTMVRTVDAERAYKRDASVVETALKRSRFIPGFVADKPVPMGYLAVVNYGSSQESVSAR